MTIPVDRLIRSRRRSIALIVHPDGSLEVRAPHLMPEGIIREFIEGHADWINKQKQRALRKAPPPPRTFARGEKFLYLGQAYPLQIVASRRTAITFDGNTFQLSRTTQPEARAAFIRWYKLRAREVLTGKVQALSNQHKFTWKKLRISSARTRWGSCSSTGTLSFTWRLIMAPPEIIEYVLIHELVHTRVQNHSRTFWSAVEALFPDYRRARAWLRKNGRSLTID